MINAIIATINIKEYKKHNIIGIVNSAPIPINALSFIFYAKAGFLIFQTIYNINPIDGKQQLIVLHTLSSLHICVAFCSSVTTALQ